MGPNEWCSITNSNFFTYKNDGYIPVCSFNDYIKNDIVSTRDALFMADLDREIKRVINSNNFKKETNKMEAKKCDRCGKLYEMPTADENGNGAEVRFKYKYIRNADRMSGNAIIEEQTRNICIKDGCGNYIDFCPACRASFKKWFESADKEEKK